MWSQALLPITLLLSGRQGYRLSIPRLHANCSCLTARLLPRAAINQGGAGLGKERVSLWHHRLVAELQECCVSVRHSCCHLYGSSHKDSTYFVLSLSTFYFLYQLTTYLLFLHPLPTVVGGYSCYRHMCSLGFVKYTNWKTGNGIESIISTDRDISGECFFFFIATAVEEYNAHLFLRMIYHYLS